MPLLSSNEITKLLKQRTKKRKEYIKKKEKLNKKIKTQRIINKEFDTLFKQLSKEDVDKLTSKLQSKKEFTEKDMDLFNKAFKSKVSSDKSLKNDKIFDLIDDKKIKEIESNIKLYNIDNKNTIDDKKLYNLSLMNILIRTKDVSLEILDDILQNKLSINTFTQDNRMFFFGISIIMTVILFYFVYILLGGDSKSNNSSNGIVINYTNN